MRKDSSNLTPQELKKILETPEIFEEYVKTMTTAWGKQKEQLESFLQKFVFTYRQHLNFFEELVTSTKAKAKQSDLQYSPPLSTAYLIAQFPKWRKMNDILNKSVKLTFSEQALIQMLKEKQFTNQTIQILKKEGICKYRNLLKLVTKNQQTNFCYSIKISQNINNLILDRNLLKIAGLTIGQILKLESFICENQYLLQACKNQKIYWSLDPKQRQQKMSQYFIR